MRNGEQRKVGTATIVCSVHRGSHVARDDRWMRSLAPRFTYSETFYRVVGSDGREVATLVKGYANAVGIALATK